MVPLLYNNCLYIVWLHVIFNESLWQLTEGWICLIGLPTVTHCLPTRLCGGLPLMSTCWDITAGRKSEGLTESHIFWHKQPITNWLSCIFSAFLLNLRVEALKRWNFHNMSPLTNTFNLCNMDEWLDTAVTPLLLSLNALVPLSNHLVQRNPISTVFNWGTDHLQSEYNLPVICLKSCQLLQLFWTQGALWYTVKLCKMTEEVHFTVEITAIFLWMLYLEQWCSNFNRLGQTELGGEKSPLFICYWIYMWVQYL